MKYLTPELFDTLFTAIVNFNLRFNTSGNLKAAREMMHEERKEYNEALDKWLNFRREKHSLSNVRSVVLRSDVAEELADFIWTLIQLDWMRGVDREAMYQQDFLGNVRNLLAADVGITEWDLERGIRRVIHKNDQKTPEAGYYLTVDPATGREKVRRIG